MTFRLAFASNAMKRYSLDDAIDLVADAGYQGMEILLDIPHAFPPNVKDADVKRWREKLDARGLAVSNCNSFMLYGIEGCHRPSWCERDPERRKLRIEHTRDCLHLAAKLGAPTISTEPGGPIDEGVTREQAADWFEEGIRSVLPDAADAGVRLCIEPEPDLLIEKAGQYEEFMQRFAGDELAEKWLGLNFDVGHFYCVGEDPAANAAKFKGKIHHIQIEDIAADRVHFHLVPGDGAIDFDEFFKQLRQADYDNGWITVELYTFEHKAVEVAQRAREFLLPYVC
ncbi:MAG: sugar phosphate isomerase/epimerase [Planctomycetes bacterium]|nr:sugar phosphate isomerase/epimerase [Planctomycetota bacterium]